MQSSSKPAANKQPWLLIAALGVAAACGPEAGPPPEGSGGPSSNPTVNAAGSGNPGDPAAAAGNTDAAMVGPVGCDREGRGPRQLRLMTRSEYARTLADLLGIDEPNVGPVPGSGIVDGYDNNVYASVVTARHVDAYMDLGQQVVDTALATNRTNLVPCAAGCEAEFVDAFGKRVWRRPLTDDEHARYMALFDPTLTEGVFDEGVKLVMRAMLLSPHFLYRSEVGTDVGGGSFQLSQHELASALSYTFWGTMPDAELLSAADNGQLSTPEQLEAQARRLLASPKSRPQVVHFFRQWLGTQVLPNANKDTYIFPHFNEAVRTALIEEEAAFIEHVVFDGSANFQELYTADYVFVNQVLGQFYGLENLPTLPTLEQVPLAGNPERGGLLGLGSVLASHAHSMETSPVKRGAFVREHLLCQDLPPPPIDVDTTPPKLDPNLTTRERFAQHTADPLCNSCHQLIDSVGFGFEAFDGVGAYRETENGQPIDSSGEVVGLETDAPTVVTPFANPQELADMLAASATAQACLAKQYARFARGFKEPSGDVCIDGLSQEFQSSLNLQDLLVSIVLEDSFGRRSLQGEQP